MVWNIDLWELLFPVFKLSRKITQPENMCHIVFENAKRHGGTFNRTSVYAEIAVQRVFWKGCYDKFHKIHKKTSVPGSFFNKVKLCGSATSLKQVLVQVFSCEFWEICTSQTFVGLEDVLNMSKSFSWKTKHCYAEDIFKTSWRHVLNTSWTHYGDKQNTYWGISESSKSNVYLVNLYITNFYPTFLRRIQNILITTQ